MWHFSEAFCRLHCGIVQSLSSVSLWLHGLHHARLPCPVSQSLHKLMPIESMMPSNYLILHHSLLLLLSLFPSIRVFSNELALCTRWPKYWRFSFSISPSNEHSGLISLRINWFDLFALRGTLKNLLQHHSLKASILQCSPLFMVQLSYPYLTTGKIILHCRTHWIVLVRLGLILES